MNSSEDDLLEVAWYLSKYGKSQSQQPHCGMHIIGPCKGFADKQYGQTMAVDMPIFGVNGETVVVRTGWMYETDALVPRLTTIFVKMRK